MTTDTRTLFAAAQLSVADALGTDVNVSRGGSAPVTVRVRVIDGAAGIGDQVRAVGSSRRLAFVKAQWDPKRADVVTLDGTDYTIRSVEPETDDGYQVEAILGG